MYDIQNSYGLNNGNLCNSYQNKEKEKKSNNFTIKQDFKNSITHWQYKKKVDKFIRTLQNKI